MADNYKYNGLYTRVIAISEEDRAYILELKKEYPKMSQAGILSFIIKQFKQNEVQKLQQDN
jgi:hypothetical protein